MTLTLQTLAERLRKAREFSGLTQAEAAEKAGMTRIALNQVEQAKRNLDTLEMSALARAYRLPLSDLFGEQEVLDPLQVLFRAEDAVLAHKGTREKVSEAYGLFREIAHLQAKLGAARATAQPLPDYGLAAPRSGPEACRQGESVAAQERKRLELGQNAVWDLAEVIRSQGILAAQMPLPKGVDGFTVFGEDAPLMVVNASVHPVKRLFSMAHELGHVRMDRKQQALVSVESDEGLLEVRANAFAAALLMPPEGVRAFVERQAVKKLDWTEAADLAWSFGVSYPAAVFRLSNLGHINSEQQGAFLAKYKQATEFFQRLRKTKAPMEPAPESLSAQLVQWALKALKSEKISWKKALELAKKGGWEAPVFERWALSVGWERPAAGLVGPA